MFWVNFFAIRQCVKYYCKRCYTSTSTIYALSSGLGKCGVAVIRISGSSAGSALKLITGLNDLPKPRLALLKNIKNPENNEVLDKGLVLWFPGPRSFTGEDCCELQVHGSIAVTTAALRALGSIQNLRLAEPGEFTRRAFLTGKLDLIEVEGLADLLQAESEVQRKQAFFQMEGFLSKTYHQWRNTLLKCVAHLEAHIDFEETETLDNEIIQQVTKDVRILSKDIEKHLSDGRKGERLRNGAKAVILGEPNVGKSSLLNALCRRPAAIVTPIEGTTRDLLEIALDIGGYPLVLTDTAGLRSNTVDIIESEGINRALKSFAVADLVILVIDSLKATTWMKLNTDKSISDYLIFYTNSLNLKNFLKFEQSASMSFKKQCIVLFNKCDLIEHCDYFITKKIRQCNFVMVSCKTEDGFTDFIEEITKRLKILCGEPSKEHPSMNQIRHREHLSNCLEQLLKFLHGTTSNVDSATDTVLLAQNLRTSIRHLGKLTGHVTIEHVLDVIFKDFCIGK